MSPVLLRSLCVVYLVDEAGGGRASCEGVAERAHWLLSLRITSFIYISERKKRYSLRQKIKKVDVRFSV